MSDKIRSVNLLRADEIFRAVTEVLRAEEAGLPFPFSGRRAPTEREVAVAKAKTAAAEKARAKAAARDKAAAKAKAEAAATATTATTATIDGRGTPEFGREEAMRGLTTYRN